jgi:hypothetical protein
MISRAIVSCATSGRQGEPRKKGEAFEASQGLFRRLEFKDDNNDVVPLTKDVATSKFKFTYTILKQTSSKVRSRALTLLGYQSAG